MQLVARKNLTRYFYEQQGLGCAAFSKGLYLDCLLHVSTDMDYARHDERAFFRL
jgi:hypothetical protein